MVILHVVAQPLQEAFLFKRIHAAVNMSGFADKPEFLLELLFGHDAGVDQLTVLLVFVIVNSGLEIVCIKLGRYTVIVDRGVDHLSKADSTFHRRGVTVNDIV